MDPYQNRRWVIILVIIAISIIFSLRLLYIQVIDKEYQQSIENDESWGWDSYAFSVKVTPTEANRGNETGEWVLAEFWTDESNIIEWYQISEGKLISWNQFRRNRQ